MRPKSLLLLTLALGCGLVASIGISQVLDRQGGQPGATGETVDIYVAKSDINLGDPIHAELIKLEAWPKDKVPRGAILELEKLEGRRPRTKIYQDEPILEVKLIATGADDNPADQIPPGYRVVSVSVDAHSGAAGLLRPGDRVDVQLFVQADTRKGIAETTTKTILKEIRVFAVDQEFRRSADKEESSVARTISLVVTPAQADKLTLAGKLGEINLIMRNPDDTSNEDLAGVGIDGVLDSSEGDRERERGLQGEKLSEAGNKFRSWLEGLNQPAATTGGPQADSAVAKLPIDGPWRMILLEGSDIREVTFSEDGQVDSPEGMTDFVAPDETTPSPTASDDDAGGGTVYEDTIDDLRMDWTIDE